jgi:hypothetical protein
MDAVVRAWLGFLAIGAGLIHLALVIGSPLPVGVPLLLIGIAEFGWGVITFTTPKLPRPRIARIAALAPVLGWALVLVVIGPVIGVGVRVLPMLVASLLDLALSIGISVVLRSRERERQPLPAGRYLLAVGLGALLIAALTTPALAATEAGDFAVPHGTFPGGSHGH